MVSGIIGAIKFIANKTEKIEKLEESHFYLDKDISLNYVAAKLSINHRYLSYVINKNKSVDNAL